MNGSVPTGGDSATVRQYYDYLYAHYLDGIQQNDVIHWDVLLWVLFWVILLAMLLFAYTRWQRSTHAPHEPYPVETYNGYIQEGNGPVGLFLTIFFVVVFLCILTMTVLNLMRGQIY
jgi:hypothetical protein